MGDRAGIAASLSNLGVVAYEQGDFDAACAYLDESVTLKRELGDRWSLAHSLEMTGDWLCSMEAWSRLPGCGARRLSCALPWALR